MIFEATSPIAEELCTLLVPAALIACNQLSVVAASSQTPAQRALPCKKGTINESFLKKKNKNEKRKAK
jgi:hypothetical protein